MDKIKDKKPAIIALTSLLFLSSMVKSSVYAVEEDIKLDKPSYLNNKLQVKEINQDYTNLQNINKNMDKILISSDISNKTLEDKEILYEFKFNLYKDENNEKSMFTNYLYEDAKYKEIGDKKFFIVKLKGVELVDKIGIKVNDKEVDLKKDIVGQDALLTFEVNDKNSIINVNVDINKRDNLVHSFMIVANEESFKILENKDSEEKNFKDQYCKEEHSKDRDNENIKRPKLVKEERKIETNNSKDKSNHKDQRKKNYNKSHIKKFNNSVQQKKQYIKHDNIDKKSLYNLHVDILKENKNTKSIASHYITFAQYEVINNDKYLILTINRWEWMTNVIVIVDGSPIRPTIIETYKNTNGEKTSRIKFKISSLNSKIKFNMNVEPMGDIKAIFRVVPDKHSLKLVNKENFCKNAPARKVNLDVKNKKEQLAPIQEEFTTITDNSNNKLSLKDTTKDYSKENLPRTGFPINTGILTFLGVGMSLFGIALNMLKK